MAVTPIDITAQVRAWPGPARRTDTRARTGRGRHHARAGGRGRTWSRTTRRPARRRWRRSTRPTGWCWVRDRGSPACSRTCWCPSCVRRLVRDPGAHAWSRSTWSRRRARPRGSLPSSTWRCSPTHAPDLAWTSCWPTAVGRSTTSRAAPAAVARSAPSWCSPTSPRDDGTPAARPGQAGRCLCGDHGGGHRVAAVRTASGCAGLRRKERTTWQDRTHGDDGTGQGGAGQHAGDKGMLPQVRGLLDASLRRRPAHRQRPHRRRGRARHRRCRPSAAQGHRRGLRAHAPTW